MTGNSVIIIGAGIGGLSAAVRLAAAGKKVIILEKNYRPGGKMSEFSQQGFRWDTGPSVITMRHVFEELFAVAGRKLDDYINLRAVDPLTRYFYPDGTIFNADRDLSKMAAQIAHLNNQDVEGYLDYLAYAARIHRITGPVFIYDKPPTPGSFLRVPVKDWLSADPFRTMNGAIRSFVNSPHLRQLLGRFATYVGGSPYLAPATLNVIAYVELIGGVWYPAGGVYTIADGMARLAQELGVEIRTNTTVRSLGLQENRVTGVNLADGTHVPASAIIANVDVTTVFRHLLPDTPAIQRRRMRLEQSEPSCSGFILMLGVEGDHPQLAHHNIFFSRDYEAEFDSIFRHGVPADDPTIYVAITSKTDPSHAPPGHENWFVLVNAPALSSRYDWSQQTQAYRDLILRRLADYGLDIREKIRVEHKMTPADLEAHTGAWRGALYGPSPNSRWAAFRRPHNRSNDVRGLYFAGGTTHPGGGVPMVTLSGKVAADFVLRDNPL